MKTFFAAVFMLLLLCGIILWNAIYLHNTTASYMLTLETLSIYDKEAALPVVEALFQDWKTHLWVYNLTINRPDTASIEEKFLLIIGALEEDSVADATIGKKQLLEQFGRIQSAMGLTWDAIL